MFSTTGQGRLPTLLLLFFFAGVASPAFAVNFNANWDYLLAGGEGRETQEQFQERYSLGAGTALGLQPTHAIAATGTVSYTRSQGRGPGGTTGADRLIPSAGLSLMNDIFQAQLSGSSNLSRPDEGVGSSNTSWDASLGSSWDIPLWPRLRFNYGEQFQFSDRLAIAGEPDQKVKDRSASVDWDLLLARLFYRYSNSQTEDLLDGSVVVNDSHFARLETGGNFWGDRLGFNLAQQFQVDTQEIRLGGPAGGVLDLPLEGQTSATVTDPATLPDPLPGEILIVEPAPAPALRDGIFDVPALAVEPGQRVHLAILFDFEQQISRLRLTLEPLTDDQSAEALQWSLFLRDLSGTGWELAAANIPTSYDSVTNRIEIPIDRLEREVMVVAVNQAAVSLQFTELEAFALLTGDAGSRSTASLTSIGMSYRISKSLAASANLTLDRLEAESGESVRESDRWSVSSNLRWNPSAYVKPSLGFSQTRLEQTGEPEATSRSYSLTVPTYPLPGVNVTFGVTRSESFTGERKTTVNDRYSLVSRAPIYPDLTAVWALSYAENENFAIDGPASASTTLSSRLDLNARLLRNLTGDLTTSWRRTETDADSTQSADATLGLRFRPSDYLALRGSYATTLIGGDQIADRLSLGLDLRLLVTHKTRLTFTATHTQAEQTSDSFGLIGNWDISRSLALVSRATYTLAESYAYSFQAGLTLRL